MLVGWVLIGNLDEFDLVFECNALQLIQIFLLRFIPCYLVELVVLSFDHFKFAHCLPSQPNSPEHPGGLAVVPKKDPPVFWERLPHTTGS